jgi:hypothetical protein
MPIMTIKESIFKIRGILPYEDAKFDASRAAFSTPKFTSMELILAIQAVKISSLSLLMKADMTKNDFLIATSKLAFRKPVEGSLPYIIHRSHILPSLLIEFHS